MKAIKTTAASNNTSFKDKNWDVQELGDWMLKKAGVSKKAKYSKYYEGFLVPAFNPYFGLVWPENGKEEKESLKNAFPPGTTFKRLAKGGGGGYSFFDVMVASGQRFILSCHVEEGAENKDGFIQMYVATVLTHARKKTGSGR